MSMTKNRKITVGLVELPEVSLFDGVGSNRAPVRPGNTLVSKQVLMASLEAGGFDVRLYNLKGGESVDAFGEVLWKGIKLTKMMVGKDYRTVSPDECDVWGVTSNFSQHRNVAGIIMRHLRSRGKPVIAGGSDAIAEPHVYLEGGADAVVLDKSGATNWAVIDALTGQAPRGSLSNVLFRDGRQVPMLKFRPGTADLFAPPSLEVVAQCLGKEYWAEAFPAELTPIGSVFSDIGCDRKCDFCQTPEYKLGYKAMSPEVSLAWFRAQRDAGARSVAFASDQFLGRVLWPEGRDEIMEIVSGVREMGLSFMFPNGLEIRKITRGRGFNGAASDLTPDEDLAKLLFGWDGEKGCYHLYLPAERPLEGRLDYDKLLPWREHCEMTKAIVRMGIPAITYGCIIGFEDESDYSLSRLEEGVMGLREELLAINPKLNFQISPFSLSPIPGTPQGVKVRGSGLLRFDDPEIIGGFWVPCADTRHLSYEQVAAWQRRLLKIGSGVNKSQFMETPFYH